MRTASESRPLCGGTPAARAAAQVSQNARLHARDAQARGDSPPSDGNARWNRSGILLHGNPFQQRGMGTEDDDRPSRIGGERPTIPVRTAWP
jgi:hypothetical protein